MITYLRQLNFKIMKLKSVIFLSILFITALTACESNSNKKNFRTTNPNLKEVVVKEVIQTSSYTYMKLEENGDEYWGAIPRNEEIIEGDTYYFDNYMEMVDFPSKELGKTFESIYFIQEVRTEPFAANQLNEQKGNPKAGNQEISPMEAVDGGITLSELFSDKSKFGGKTVKIRGMVVKFTAGVMQKNWIHIQDGTRSGNQFDLTITTIDECKLGDIVTFEGKVSLNRDFGYGYSYDILIEDAKLLDLEKATSLQ